MSSSPFRIGLAGHDDLVCQALSRGLSAWAKRHQLPWKIIRESASGVWGEVDLLVDHSRPSPDATSPQLFLYVGIGSPHVCFDNAALGQVAAVHLREGGWQRALVITREWGVRQQREQAFIAEFRRLGGEVSAVCVPESIGCEQYVAWLRTVMVGLRLPLAVFAFQDREAQWLSNAFRNVGLRIPEDIGLIGCEDTPVAQGNDPPLSSVRTPWQILGEKVGWIIQQYQGTGHWPEPIRLPPMGVAARRSSERQLPNSPLVERAMSRMRRSLPKGLSCRDLCKTLKISEDTLARAFLSELGMTPGQMMGNLRLVKVESWLVEKPDLPLGEVARRCGWSSASALVRAFHRQRGITPDRFRQKQ